MSEITFSVGQPDDESADAAALPTHTEHAGGSGEIHWHIVARTPGLVPAQIIAGRLQAEGIMARAWAESAGVALGLTVGLLGTGYVGVPEELVEQAEAILAVEYDEEE
ncbi:MAG: hypothetical protein KJ063_15135 [Anaerolineae bacterium]|nr:hypothetical protein [Anaerolineae bacterium]